MSAFGPDWRFSLPVDTCPQAGSAAKVDACYALGADHVVNYKEEDFQVRERALTFHCLSLL